MNLPCNCNDCQFTDVHDAHSTLDDAILTLALPNALHRRAFLRGMGKSALAYIATLMPIAPLHDALASTTTQRHQKLRVAFLPILCATPLIVAQELGVFSSYKLNVDLQKRSSWALVRDEIATQKLHASHLLAPMPLAMSLGLGSPKVLMRVATMQNTNGQALVMSLAHRHRQNPKDWRGFRFGIPFVHSMHNYLLRDFLLKHGLNPDKDVRLLVLSPADMIANLRANNIDGFFGPEPFNQRAVWEKVGYIHTLSHDMLNGHPCCAFGVRDDFAKTYPDEFLALALAMRQSQRLIKDMHANLPMLLSAPRYLNQPPLVIEQALTGRFADGLGRVQSVPNRTGFDATLAPAMLAWLVAQMQRFGYTKSLQNCQTQCARIATEVFGAT